MSKRSLSINEYECIARKIKKLETKLVRARKKDQRASSSSSGSTCSNSSCSTSSSRSSSRHSTSRHRTSHNMRYIQDVPAVDYPPGPSSAPHVSATQVPAPPPPAPHPLQPQPETSALAADTPPATAPALPTDPPPPPASSTEPPPPPPASSTDPPPPPAAIPLNKDLLEILGEDPTQKKIYGKDIHPDLVVRLQHIAAAGLTDEVRKELLDKYRIPANCTLIDAPTLNAEVKAAVTETVYKRDKGIEQRQKQIGSAIACIAQALTLLLTAEQTNTDLIILLMDAQKVLCDSQYTDSALRRSFILYNLKKELKDQLKNTKIDKFLFSEDLAETIKTANAITKSGADLKVAPAKQPTKNINKNRTNNLNWRGPPQYRRPTGTHRTTQPANKSRRDNSSRQSSRHTHTSSSRSHRRH